jgi:hypothetical protein
MFLIQSNRAPQEDQRRPPWLRAPQFENLWARENILCLCLGTNTGRLVCVIIMQEVNRHNPLNPFHLSYLGSSTFQRPGQLSSFLIEPRVSA